MCFPETVWRSHWTGLEWSAFTGDGFPSKLGGAADQESVGSVPMQGLQTHMASEQPAAGLFSQGCEILLLSWTGKLARALEQLPLPLSWEARSRAQIEQVSSQADGRPTLLPSQRPWRYCPPASGLS